MLEKLLNYEIKANLKIFLPFYAIASVACIGISILSRILGEVYYYTEYGSLLDMIIELWLTMIPAIIIGVLLAIGITSFVFMVQRFYKTMISKEAYLTFSLPATIHDILLSKIITSILILILNVVFIVVLFFIMMMGYIGSEWSYLIYEFSYIMNELMWGSGFALEAIAYIILMGLGYIATLVLIYLSIACGSLFKNKILMSIVSYFGINIVSQILSAFFFGMYIMLIISMNLWAVLLLTIITVVLEIVISYFAMAYIFTKKLNLE